MQQRGSFNRLFDRRGTQTPWRRFSSHDAVLKRELPITTISLHPINQLCDTVTSHLHPFIHTRALTARHGASLAAAAARGHEGRRQRSRTATTVCRGGGSLGIGLASVLGQRGRGRSAQGASKKSVDWGGWSVETHPGSHIRSHASPQQRSRSAAPYPGPPPSRISDRCAARASGSSSTCTTG